MKIDSKEFEKAYQLISSLLPATPLVKNDWLSRKYEANVFLKLESLQPVGSFKLRGAANKIFNLSDEEKKKREDARAGQNESKLLKFGEFISEGVMNDLLKAGKSKKDSEITLDDGADIPIDPLTSQILVKYIEGLSSSEKNRTIQQIQRTERAFMKVLGKAHENT